MSQIARLQWKTYVKIYLHKMILPGQILDVVYIVFTLIRFRLLYSFEVYILMGCYNGLKIKYI